MPKDLDPKMNKETKRWTVIDWDNMTNEEVVNVVTDRFSEVVAQRKVIEEGWRMSAQYYLDQSKNRTYGVDTDGNLYAVDNSTPALKTFTLYSLIQDQVARRYALMFDTNPIIRVEPANSSTTDSQARKWERLFSNQFVASRPRMKLARWLLSISMYGTAWLHPIYLWQTNTKYTRSDKDDKRMFMPDETTEKRPDFEVPSIFDVYPDMTAKSYEDMSFAILVKYTRLSDLLNSRDNIINVDELISTTRRSGSAKIKNEDIKQLENATVNNMSADERIGAVSDELDPLVEVRVYYEADRIIMIANQKLLIFNQPNPYKFKKIPLIPASGFMSMSSIYGENDIDAIKFLTTAQDVLLNQSIDYTTSAVRRKIARPFNFRIDLDALVSPDEASFECDDPEALKDFVLNPSNASAMNELMFNLGAMAENVIGKLPFNQAMQSNTATGVYAANNEGMIKAKFKASMLEEALIDFAEFWRQLNYQYMPNTEVKDTRKLPDGTSSFLPVTFNDLNGSFEYSFNSQTNSEEKALRYERIRALYMMLSSDLKAGVPININVQYILEHLIKESGLPGWEQALKKEVQSAVVPPLPQNGGGMVPPPNAATPEAPAEEMQRRNISDAANPDNFTNGGPK